MNDDRSASVKDDSNVKRFPLGDRAKAADDLRHMADLVEQGVVEMFVGVFIESDDWYTSIFKGGKGQPYDAVRLAGVVTLAHRYLIDSVMTDAEVK